MPILRIRHHAYESYKAALTSLRVTTADEGFVDWYIHDERGEDDANKEDKREGE